MSEASFERLRWPVFTAAATLTLLADQLSKWWARSQLPTDADGNGIAVRVVADLWDWRLAYNEGSAFSLLEDVASGRTILTVIGFIAVGILLYMAKETRIRSGLWSLGLILGGTVGNLIDRVSMGRVTDFVLWRYHDMEWPIFNVADVALCIGIGVLMLAMFRTPSVRTAAETVS